MSNKWVNVLTIRSAQHLISAKYTVAIIWYYYLPLILDSFLLKAWDKCEIVGQKP